MRFQFFRFQGVHPAISLYSYGVMRWIMTILGACFVPMAGAASYQQVVDGVKAKSCLLVDAGTGNVLFARQPHAKHPPASTVKLMTALLVYQRTGLQGTSEVVSADTKVEPSHVPLRVGERVSVREMTRTLLVGSDNDSALFLGRQAAGSWPEFVQMMNTYARRLGCTNTVFKNPNGLPAKGQYTTCFDLLKIFNETLRVPELRKMLTTKGFTLETAVGSQWVKNHNKLLGKYEGMGPAKTGWTFASRHTYAASAERNGRELRLIILNSPNKWVDAKLLLDYGFSLPAERLNRSANFAGSSNERIYRVRSGDTLTEIATKNGVSLNTLVEYNGIKNPDFIREGMVLRIPSNS
jgi:D-alanyl-D-alanine carboxypeptidase (penicillin-binding protein 5/6)